MIKRNSFSGYNPKNCSVYLIYGAKTISNKNKINGKIKTILRVFRSSKIVTKRYSFSQPV